MNQRQRYGLLGRKIGYSYSPEIHYMLTGHAYELFQMEPEALHDFVDSRTWSGLNVTIPYKEQVLEAVDERSWEVEAIGAANTLCRNAKTGKIRAYNSDLHGFIHAFEKLRLKAARPVRHALILGSGGAAKACAYGLRQLGIETTTVSRRGRVNYGNLLEAVDSCDAIINATPCGAENLPHASAISFHQLEQLKPACVMDLIYNPFRTKLLLMAERLEIPYDNGLTMLVAQAVVSSALWQGSAAPFHLDGHQVDDIRQKLAFQKSSLTLVGMPGAGKTTMARELARITDKPLYDLDLLIEDEVGTSCEAYLCAYGTNAFRQVELNVLTQLVDRLREPFILACGGGTVELGADARNRIREKSHCVWLKRDLRHLSLKGRPLSQEYGVRKLYRRRAPLYAQWADMSWELTGDNYGDAENILSKIYKMCH